MDGVLIVGRYLCKCPPESGNSARAGGPLWRFDFAEMTGHNLETRGRKEVNRLLQAGWRLLVYTLRYEENGVRREFGDRHHTTVLHSVNKIEAMRRKRSVEPDD